MKYETAHRRARIKAMVYWRCIITREAQTDSTWVFALGARSGESITANLPIFVFDKEGDSSREVLLPSKEGFAILEKERPI